MAGKKDHPIKGFTDAAKWRAWLEKNHLSSDGLWLRIYKKASEKKTVDYQQALVNALCFGWIDGQRNSYDEISFLQKFTPRRKRSIWSKRNCEICQRLIDDGLMTEAGHREIESAKLDGRWDNAYHGPKDMQMPDDFIRSLKKNKKAHTFFQTLNKQNTYAIAFRLHNAKRPETREKRITGFITMLERGEKIY